MLAGTTAAGFALHAVPALTSVAPVRRRLLPALSGIGRPGHVALTFDDGPDRRSTPRFLHRLDRAGVRATFFLLGSLLDRDPGLGREMTAQGHEVAVHGWEHHNLLCRTPSATYADIARARDRIAELTDHELSRQQATAVGSAPVRVVRPLVNARFAASAQLSAQAARRQFGLPEQGRLALIVAGSWGMGDVARTATEVLATGCVEPVVVCGRNQRLYRRLRRFPGHVLGWVDDMPTLMRAADVVVENAGGLTCQEALASGRPTITYRPIAGHGRANADLLSRSALTSHIDSAQRLRPALTELLAAAEGGDPGADARIDMAGVVADVLTPMRWGWPG